MQEPLSLYSAFVIGLLGSTHCLGMCGGIALALSVSLPRALPPWLSWTYLTLFSLGRLTSYAIAGALVGGLGFLLADQIGTTGSLLLRMLAGLMLIALGFYLGGWWHGLLKLEAMGKHVWKRVSPITQRLLPINSPPKALIIGMLWGWLPCGLVYSTLAWAGSSGGAITGAGLMAAFGLGTLPAMVITGKASEKVSRVTRNARVRHLVGVLMIGFGVWTIAIAVVHQQHAGHGQMHDAHHH